MEIRQIKRTDNKIVATLIKSVFEEYNAPKEGTVYSDAATNSPVSYTHLTLPTICSV